MQNKYLTDKERLDFLQIAFFGGEKNPYVIASKKAYRDLCKTLCFNGGSGQKYSEQVDKLLEEKVKYAISGAIQTQEQYDDWHKKTCSDMAAFYKLENIVFNIGHAQKWINMMMKYLCIQGKVDVTSIFYFLHVPLDRLIIGLIDKFDRNDARTLSCVAWSKINDYKIYLDYQIKIRVEIQKKDKKVPLLWEMSSWIKEMIRRG